ncbi:MAG: hypothetical protein IT350_10905 [Deltaproteobacteria bacterium]|nr:hypothetical protein [Deltaproteobacteria bacterium]
MKQRIVLGMIATCLCAVAIGCGFSDDDDDSDGMVLVDDDDDTGADDDTWAPLPDDDADDDADDDVDDDADDDADDDTEPCDLATHDPLIEAGRAKLSELEPQEAYAEFTAALAACPGSGVARYGLLLSDVQWYMVWTHEWVDYLADYNPAPHATFRSLGTTIQTTFRYQMLPINAEMARLADEIEQDHAGATIALDTFPLWVDDGETTLDVPGEWDIADVGTIRTFIGLWQFVAHALLSFDVDFNFSTFALQPPPEGATPTEVVHHYAGVILEILGDEDYPDFLTFLPGGEQELETAAVEMGHGLRAFAAGFAAVRDETDPQTNDVAGYVDENDNGHWDNGEPYRIPVMGDLTDEESANWQGIVDMTESLGLAFLDGGPDDVHEILPDWFWISDANGLLEFLGVELALPPIPLPVGPLFYDPPADGLRGTVTTLAEAIYAGTTP